MEKIVDFNRAKQSLNLDITEKDLFNMYLIMKKKSEFYVNDNIEILMKSFGKYANMKRYSKIYANLNPRTNEKGEPIIDLLIPYEECLQQKVIIEDLNKNLMILDGEYVDNLEKQYSRDMHLMFDSLMFNVSQDLEYGLDGWQLVCEDEYVQAPGYPGIVTSEFIGQKKTERVKKKIKKRTIERLKDGWTGAF